jgi:hypothetical protein
MEKTIAAVRQFLLRVAGTSWVRWATSVGVFYGLIGLGALLHLWKYAYNRSLWLDEARIALNVIGRSPAELLRPLDFNQASPWGFLLLLKASTSIFGIREPALRLVPLIAGLLSLWLFYLWVRARERSVALLAVALFAFCPPLIQYASELKPYAVDVFIATALLLLWAWYGSQNRSLLPRAALAAAGALAVWFSYPAVFVLAGIACIDLWQLARARSLRSFLAESAVIGVWGVSFLISYGLSRGAATNPVLLEFWTKDFFPWPTTPMSAVRWLVASYENLFTDTIGLAAYSGAALLFGVGMLSLLGRRERRLSDLVLPLLFALLASVLHLYPFGGRLLLFAAPMLLLGLAEGAARVAGSFASGRPLVWGLLAGLLLLAPVGDGLQNLGAPETQEEMRPLIERLSRESGPADALYVYDSARYGYLYYRMLFPVHVASTLLGEQHRDNPDAHLKDLAPLLGRDRTWFLFSHAYIGPRGSEEVFIKGFLGCQGTVVADYQEPGADLILYDLSDRARDLAWEADPTCAWRWSP